MISWMQTNRKYLIVTIWISTIAFVGAGFVGWGAYSFGSGGKDGEVAKVGDRELSVSQLQSSYDKVYNYYNQLLGGKLTKEKAQELRLQDVALNQLIKESLLLNFAKDLGIVALDSEIAARINSIDNFKVAGKFDKDTYLKVLKSINKKVQEFEDEIKREIIIEKLAKALSLPTTELELKTVTSSLSIEDKIKAKIVDVKDSEIEISDEELKEYWGKNRGNYLSKKSYEVEVIKVASSNIDVNDSEVLEFYNQKKHLFKGDDDKILKFEEAKEQVVKKVQLKKAKKIVLKKYLALKNGKIEADKKLVLTAENSQNIPISEIAKLKVGSFAKAIELEDGYITAKLLKVDEPMPLEFEKAKESVRADLFQKKRKEILEAKVKEEAKELKDTQELDFISKADTKKVNMLSEDEAKLFLDQLFLSSQKKGYYIFDDKAIVYEIVDQRFSSKDRLKDEKEELSLAVDALKNSTIQNTLLDRLEKRYKIIKYNKG